MNLKARELCAPKVFIVGFRNYKETLNRRSLGQWSQTCKPNQDLDLGVREGTWNVLFI